MERFPLFLPHQEGMDMIRKARRFGLFPSQITRVIPRPDKKCNRLLIELSKEVKAFIVNTITIRDKKGDYHKEYVRLTKDFYLNF